jgi:tetratricopeptide (TPR) repeat protein
MSQFLQIILTLALSVLLTVPAIAAEKVTAPATIPNTADIQKNAETLLDDLALKAITATNNGNFSEAEIHWTAIINQFPDNAAAWSNRGNAKSSQNHLEEAIADYTKAIELAPTAPDPYLNRGAAYQALDKTQEAIADYNQVLTLDPQDPDAFNNRGNALASLGKWTEAIADFKEAFEIEPNYAFARANYALALYETGEVQQSVKTMKNLLRKYPNFVDMRAALTAILWEQKKTGEAESNWISVPKVDPRYQYIEWITKVRRWPPTITNALANFLKLETAVSPN